MESLDLAERAFDRQAQNLAEKYRGTDPIPEEARKQLSEIVEKQFAIRQKRRELELHHLEGQLTRLREAIEKRNASRDAIIKQRVGQLLGDHDEVGF